MAAVSHSSVSAMSWMSRRPSAPLTSGLEFSSESADFSDDDDDANNNNNGGDKAYDTSIVPFSGDVSDEFSFRQLIGDWLHWHFDEVYNHYYRQMVHQLPQHLIHMSDNELL